MISFINISGLVFLLQCWPFLRIISIESCACLVKSVKLMNKNTELFKLIPCFVNQIVFENHSDYIVGLLVDGLEDEIGIPLNNYDGSILTFVHSGCAEHAHINTIHQILLKFMENAGFDLEKVYIEAKYGDITYCRLKWTKLDQSIYNIIGIGDALILHSLTACDMVITQNVLKQFEKFDSSGYLDTYED